MWLGLKNWTRSAYLHLCAKKINNEEVPVRRSQVQMKRTNTDFRGLITNRDVRTLLPILRDWLFSPERQPRPIEINRIFAVGFPGTKIAFPIIHHLILGMSFGNWFAANLQEKLALLKNMFYFFLFFFSPSPFVFSPTAFTVSNSPFTNGIHFPWGFFGPVLLRWRFFLLLFFVFYYIP